MNTEIKKLPGSVIEITGEIPKEQFEGYRKEAIKNLSENFEADGFRKGKVPENIFLSKVPTIKILEEMAEIALSHHYISLLKEHSIDAIGRPEIIVTKLAENNPLGFKITTSVLPEVVLGDYKSIAQKGSEHANKEVPEITEKEVDDTINNLRKMRAHEKLHEGDEPGAEPNHDHGEIAEETFPPIDDAFAQSFGNFKTVEDLRKKIKDNIALEKKQKAKEKVRIDVMEKILEGATIDLPRVLIDAELDKMLFRLKTDVEQMGFTFEKYLTELKKTEEEIRKEWEADAMKRAKLELILHHISMKENLKPDEKDVEHEVSRLLEQYKDADVHRAKMYVENMLMNEKVFQFLENQGTK